MKSSKFILFLTIWIIVVAFNVENAKTDETDPFKLFEFAFNSLMNTTVSGVNKVTVCKNQTGVQTPEMFCSSKVPNLSVEELGRLSALGLGASTSTEVDVHNTSEHFDVTSQSDLGASSFKDFDLNLTTEEYNEMVVKKKKMKIT